MAGPLWMARDVGQVCEDLLRRSVYRDLALNCGHGNPPSLWCVGGEYYSAAVYIASFAALMKARILATSFTPSLSTPEETSTAQGWTMSTARATLSGRRPPASTPGSFVAPWGAPPQSRVTPAPP